MVLPAFANDPYSGFMLSASERQKKELQISHVAWASTRAKHFGVDILRWYIKVRNV